MRVCAKLLALAIGFAVCPASGAEQQGVAANPANGGINPAQSPLAPSILQDAPPASDAVAPPEQKRSAQSLEHYFVYLDYGMFSYGGAPRNTAWGALLGAGYNLNEHLALEGGLGIIGSADSGTCYSTIVTLSTCPSDSLGAESYQAAAVGTLPITANDDLIGKLGLAYTSFSYSYSYTPCFLAFCSPTVTGSGSASKTNPLFAIGWQWKSSGDTRNSDAPGLLKFRVQYENLGRVSLPVSYSDRTSRTFDIGIEFFSVGLLYNF